MRVAIVGGSGIGKSSVVCQLRGLAHDGLPGRACNIASPGWNRPDTTDTSGYIAGFCATKLSPSWIHG